MSGLHSVSSMPFSVSHCVSVSIPFVPFVVYILFGVHIYGSYFEVCCFSSFASCLSSRSCLIAGDCVLLTPCWSFPHQPSGSPSHCLLILAAVLQMFSVFGFPASLCVVQPRPCMFSFFSLSLSFWTDCLGLWSLILGWVWVIPSIIMFYLYRSNMNTICQVLSFIYTCGKGTEITQI